MYAGHDDDDEDAELGWFGKKIAKGIKKGFKHVKKHGKKFGKHVKKHAKKGLKHAKKGLNYLKKQATDTWKQADEWHEKVKNEIKEFDTLVSKAKTLVDEIKNAKDYIEDAFDDIGKMFTDLNQMVAPGAEAEVAAGSELGGGNKLTQLKDKFVDFVKEVPGTMKREMEKLCDSLMPVEGEALSDNINGVIKGAFSASASMGSASRHGESGEIPPLLGRIPTRRRRRAVPKGAPRRTGGEDRRSRVSRARPNRTTPDRRRGGAREGFLRAHAPFLDLLPDTTPTPQHVIPEWPEKLSQPEWTEALGDFSMYFPKEDRYWDLCMGPTEFKLPSSLGTSLVNGFKSALKPVCMHAYDSVEQVVKGTDKVVKEAIGVIEKKGKQALEFTKKVKSKLEGFKSKLSGRRLLADADIDDEEFKQLVYEVETARAAHAEIYALIDELEHLDASVIRDVEDAAKLATSRVLAQLLEHRTMWNPAAGHSFELSHHKAPAPSPASSALGHNAGKRSGCAHLVPADATDHQRAIADLGGCVDELKNSASTAGGIFKSALNKMGEAFEKVTDFLKQVSLGFFVETNTGLSFVVHSEGGKFKQGDVLEGKSNPIEINSEIALFYGFSVKVNFVLTFSMPYYVTADMEGDIKFDLDVTGTGFEVGLAEGKPFVNFKEPKVKFVNSNAATAAAHLQLGMSAGVESNVQVCFGGKICSGPAVELGQSVYAGIDTVASSKTADFEQDKCNPREFELSARFVEWDYPDNTKGECTIPDGKDGQLAGMGAYVQVPAPVFNIGIMNEYPAAVDLLPKYVSIYAHEGDDVLMKEVKHECSLMMLED